MRIQLIVALLISTLVGLGLAPAPSLARGAQGCRFVLGFKTLRDLIPDVAGDCLVDEHHNPADGDGLQETTKGLLVWRKADNWTAFTDGYRTWINGPNGLQVRLNAERFPWERGDPSIEFTNVPPYGSFANLVGRVSYASPADFAVAVYIRVEGGWWSKPYWDSSVTAIRSDGTWTCDITTGGIDEQATEIQAYLIAGSYKPPLMSGGSTLPGALAAFPHASVTRSPTQRRIQFSGYEWSVKSSVSAVEPGPNYFADSADNVWLDGSGQLHLRLTRRAGRWYAAEVVSVRSFGYGRYTFALASPVATLNPNTVLGLFTYSPDPEYGHREMDVEFSRWSDPSTPLNAQFVLQPWNLPGHRHRFSLAPTASSVHSFEWGPDSIAFTSRDGSGAPLEAWSYPSRDVPRPGDEKARMSLWLVDGRAPPDGSEVEVVVRAFTFEPPN